MGTVEEKDVPPFSGSALEGILSITFLSLQGSHLLGVKLTAFLSHSLSREYEYELSVTFPHSDPVFERDIGLMMMMMMRLLHHGHSSSLL